MEGKKKNKGKKNENKECLTGRKTKIKRAS